MIAAGVVRPSESGAESEVGEFDVSVTVDEHVVRLDVAVNEAHPVHAVDGQHQLGDEEPRQLLVEDAESNEQTHQVAAGDVLHHKVQVRRVLHRSNGDCLEGKRENYQVCYVQYCVQQLCTVRCTHI